MGSGGNFLDDALNVATNTVTFGSVGFSGTHNGFDVNKGVVGGAAVDATKEITGAKAAEQANALARTQFEQAQAAAKKQQADQQTANANAQVKSSNAAASARNSSKNSGVGASRAQLSILNNQTDFLGL